MSTATTTPPRRRRSTNRLLISTLLVALAITFVAWFGHDSKTAHGPATSEAASSTTPSHLAKPKAKPTATPAARPAVTRRPPQSPATSGALTLFDVDDPAIANLHPHLRTALQEAARDAQKDGVPFTITSGWRSKSHQARLFAEAIARYGSKREASRYVSTPDTSAHVTGDAVDVGPTAADDWLSRHGSTYGLCQTYANEMWHFELATVPGGECPAKLVDASARTRR